MVTTYAGWTLQYEPVKCGRNGCPSCPHGPYWYGYRRDGRKVKKKYFGKELPTGSHTEAAGDSGNWHAHASASAYAEAKAKANKSEAERSKASPKHDPKGKSKAGKGGSAKASPKHDPKGKSKAGKGGSAKASPKQSASAWDSTYDSKYAKMLDAKTATLSMAVEILGIFAFMAKNNPSPKQCMAEARKRFRILSMKNHPDRGGKVTDQKVINAAWDYVKTHRSFAGK